jgi:LPXTG-motif cell wall-anchored protein
VKKLIASVAVVLCAILGFGAPALAQSYPPTVLVIVIVSGPVTPGSTVTITITGCQAGETVTVAVDGVTVTVSTCTGGGGTSAMPMQAAGGSATASFTAPAAGTHTITATGNTSGLVGSLTFTVQQPATTTTAAPGGGGALPTTGSDSTPTLWIAGASIAVGLGLAGVAWKRRHPSAA